MPFYGEEYKDTERMKPDNPHIQTIGDLYTGTRNSKSMALFIRRRISNE